MAAWSAEILADLPATGHYVELEETSGAHIDMSANARASETIVVAGQGTAGPVAGLAGPAKGDDFNGTSSYVSWADDVDFFPGAQEDFSLMLVVAADTIDDTYRRIVSHEAAGDHGYNITVQNISTLVNHPDDGIRFERKSGTGTGVFVSSGASPSTGVMPVAGTAYVVHATFDVTASNTATLKLYINGALVAEKTGQTIGNMTDPAASLQLGRRSSDASRYFDGKIYSFAYFPGVVLSPARVTAQYAARDTVGTVDPAQNANTTVTIGDPFRLRMRVQEKGGVAITTGYKLQVSKNSGAYADVVTGSGDVRITASPNITHGAATSELLTGGTGSYVAGQALDTSGTSGDIPLTAGAHTEILWSLDLFSGADEDTYDFKVTLDDGTALEAYELTPRVTAAA